MNKICLTQKMKKFNMYLWFYLKKVFIFRSILRKVIVKYDIFDEMEKLKLHEKIYTFIHKKKIKSQMS